MFECPFFICYPSLTAKLETLFLHPLLLIFFRLHVNFPLFVHRIWSLFSLFQTFNYRFSFLKPQIGPFFTILYLLHLKCREKLASLLFTCESDTKRGEPTRNFKKGGNNQGWQSLISVNLRNSAISLY